MKSASTSNVNVLTWVRSKYIEGRQVWWDTAILGLISPSLPVFVCIFHFLRSVVAFRFCSVFYRYSLVSLLSSLFLPSSFLFCNFAFVSVSVFIHLGDTHLVDNGHAWIMIYRGESETRSSNPPSYEQMMKVSRFCCPWPFSPFLCRASCIITGTC